ncbi:MAG: TauD/TfdA family dioxygenase, partial [Pseudomonadales bacterium]
MQHTASSQGWSVQRLSAALGAEISGVDLRSNQNSTIDTIRSLLLEHQVLFFPDQHLSVDEHVRLGE